MPDTRYAVLNGPLHDVLAEDGTHTLTEARSTPAPLVRTVADVLDCRARAGLYHSLFSKRFLCIRPSIGMLRSGIRIHGGQGCSRQHERDCRYRENAHSRAPLQPLRKPGAECRAASAIGELL